MSISDVPAVVKDLRKRQPKDAQFDQGEATTAIGYAVNALKLMLERLANAQPGEYAEGSFKDVAQSSAYVAKVVDEMTRLIQFMRGEPDSRQEVVVDELVRRLSPEQLDTLDKWVKLQSSENQQSH